MTAPHDDSPPPAPSWPTVAAGLMIAAAGVACWWALVLRWHGCLAGLDRSPCGIVQDHLYDYFLPTAPWVAIPGTAVLEGMAFLLLAAALALGATRLMTGSTVRVLWWVLLGTVALIGVLNLASGLLSAPLPFGLQVAMIWSVVGLVVLIVVLADARGVTGWLFILVLAAIAVHHTPFDVGSIYAAHDTAPWNGATSATSFVALGSGIAAAGLALRGGRNRAGRRRRRQPA